MNAKTTSFNPAITNANRHRGGVVRNFVAAVMAGKEVASFLEEIQVVALRSSSLGFQDRDLSYWMDKLTADEVANDTRREGAMGFVGRMNAKAHGQAMSADMRKRRDDASKQASFFGTKSRATAEVRYALEAELAKRQTPVVEPVKVVAVMQTEPTPASAPLKLKIAKKVKKIAKKRDEFTDCRDSFEALAELFKYKEVSA